MDKTEYNVVILVEGRTIKSTSTDEYRPEYKYYEYNDPEPLERATITLLDYDKTFTTDSDGKATLKLQAGEYRITVEKTGYIDSDPSYNNSYNDYESGTLEVYGNAFEDVTLYKKP